MKLQLRRGGRRAEPGRLPSLGQDYDRAHREYVSRLPASGRLWLRTKPFSAPPSVELAPSFHTFAHVVAQLGLGLRAQVLDVGCGPGWLSEFLARCGYWVTGVDISEDMIEIARERVAAIPHPVAEGIEAHAELHAMHVRDMPWENRFDAAILYDTLHHFDDELETLRVLLRALVPGGRIYIREGARPDEGSESERNLIAEMRQWGTLESPFHPQYLQEVLEQAGFVNVRRFVELDELLDVHDARRAGQLLRRYLRVRLGRALPETNTAIAAKPIPVAQDGAFEARLTIVGPVAVEDERVRVAVLAENTGRGYWPAANGFPYPQGAVTLGPYVLRDGQRHELPRAELPRSLGPGDSATVLVAVPRPPLGGARELAIDLVREGISWFSEPDSPPLRVPLDL